jgi:hypothetical protein
MKEPANGNENKGAPKMAKGNDQKRCGELESTMATKSN